MRHPRVRPLLAGFAVALAACGGSGSATIDTAAPISTVATSVPVASTISKATPPTSNSSAGAPSSTTTAPAGSSSASPLVFPGSDWETASFPGGVDRAAVDAAVDTAFGPADNRARVRSVLAVRGGKIVYERYHPLDSAETVMASFSVAKSFTSAVIGLLVGDGKLDLDAPAPVAAWADPTDPRHAITLADLLHMASGLEWNEAYAGTSDLSTFLGAPVASDYVAAKPLDVAPGTQFKYSTGTTALLAGIITDTLGGPDQADAYIHERLLDPIGITSTRFLRDRAGRWLGGLGADSTARDFARFGWLFLNDGVWNGERVLPEGWVEYSRTPSTTNPQYGAQWWMLRPDAFEARGLFGQMIIVSPVHDLVLVITSNQGSNPDPLAEVVYDAFAAA